MEPVTIISNHVAQNFVLEYRRNTGITEQEPAVEKRRVRLHVRFIKFLEIVRVADLLAVFELQIPQPMPHRLDRRFAGIVFEEEDQVDVRLRMERAAAVT